MQQKMERFSSPIRKLCLLQVREDLRYGYTSASGPPPCLKRSGACQGGQSGQDTTETGMKAMRQQITWVPALDRRLIELRNEGHSMAKIAEIMSEDFICTKNMIVGRISRLRKNGFEVLTPKEEEEKSREISEIEDRLKKNRDRKELLARQSIKRNTCSYAKNGFKCTLTKQPGRDFCARHHTKMNIGANKRRRMF